MSRSPDDATKSSQVSTEFENAASRLQRLAMEGVSWSGHERNCAFLNTGKGRFTNISAASGFDLPDDGRSLALVDWDRDGDLDVWMANRTGPRIRLLKNDTHAGHNFLAVKLEGNGSTTNRDAIGARVVVKMRNAEIGVRNEDEKKDPAFTTPHSALVKTVRAGEGFLGQSTKWLHFGLGNATYIDRVVVHWPGGTMEEFLQLDANGRYHLVQDRGLAEKESTVRPVRLSSSISTTPMPSERARILLTSRLQLPTIAYRSFADQNVTLNAEHVTPILLNLWAAWCTPCKHELKEFAQKETQLRRAGLDIVVLSVDHLDESTGTNAESPQHLLSELQFPFRNGLATTELVDVLQIVHNHLFRRHRPLPIPVSFLIDASGRLAAIYKGPVEADQLIRDVKSLVNGGPELLRAALPFPGRWFGPSPHLGNASLVSTLAQQGHLDLAVDYLHKHRSPLANESNFDVLLSQLGNDLVDRGQMTKGLQLLLEAQATNPEIAQYHFNVGVILAKQRKVPEAFRHFRRALEIEPDHAETHNSLGYELQLQGKSEDALHHFRRAVSSKPDFAKAHSNLGAALLFQRKFDEAMVHLRDALFIEPDFTDPRINLAIALFRQGKLDDAIGHFRRVLEMTPDNAAVHRHLGSALRSKGKFDEGLTHLRQAVQLKPQWPRPMHELAWILATNPDANVRKPHEAVQLAERAAAITQHRDPRVLDTLAAAYASQGQFLRAIKAAQRAMQLADSAHMRELSSSIEIRLKLYQQRKAYREQ